MFQSLTSLGGSSLSSVATFHLALSDVNDNPPRLATDHPHLFLCHPLQAPGSVIFEATDDDQQFFRGPRFTFSLGSKVLENDWEVKRINGELSKNKNKNKKLWVVQGHRTNPGRWEVTVRFYGPWCARSINAGLPGCRQEVRALKTCREELFRGEKALGFGGRKDDHTASPLVHVRRLDNRTM